MKQLVLNWNIFDFIIVGIIFLSVITGFFRGFLREAISLATLFLAFYAALKFSPALGGIFQSFISTPKIRYIIAAILTFLIVLLLGMIINKLAHGLVTVSGLGLIDKILGLVFGAARGVLFVTIILLIIQVGSFHHTAWYEQSQLTPRFQPIVARFSGLIPKDVLKVSAWMHHFSLDHKT